MADESGIDAKFAALTKKMETENRFTRNVIVVCTAAILGVSLVPVKIMLSDLPTIIWAEFMNKLEQTHANWKVYDRKFANETTSGSSTATTTSTAAEEKKEK
ncbi:MAG: hypothetical protein K2X27_07975 [Candidatus Obscuribacterales bacterium]|nr:hypothetical protein [Candidatus Obscuribacterales bacterium]